MAVFYDIDSTDPGTERTEYNIVFKDEDAPVGDKLYDVFRRSTYGRTADIETLVVYRDRETGSVVDLEFSRSYSGGQQFLVVVPEHFSQSLQGSFQAVYLNTWNHLFAEYDTNPGLDKYSWVLRDRSWHCSNGMSAVCVDGSRQDAEMWVRNHE